MSVITLPEGILLNEQTFGVKDYGVTFSNEESGASQVVVHGPSRLTCSIRSNELLDDEQAALWSSLVFALEGQVNYLAVYNVRKPVPRGTLRGVPTLHAAAVAGTSTLEIATSQPGSTLLRGDWVGLAQSGTNRQLLHVQADAVANAGGVMAVTVAPRLRGAHVSGATVVVDKPTCLMRRSSAESQWTASGAVEGGYSLDLIEHWGS